MKQILTVIVGLFIAAGIGIPAPASAQPMCPDCPMWREQAPYGDYCTGRRWGWYGAKKTVETPEQAEIILQEYFSKADIKIGRIKEKRWFFEAEILDKNNVLIDIVIVDKRTGRIRSTH